MWLNFKIFGNGYGLASPYCDEKFYWLVDTSKASRNQKNGRFYTWLGGFGAQLVSFEWRYPKVGTRRKLFGHEFTLFNATRKFIKVRCSWTLVESEKLEGLKEKLESWGHGL